MSAGRHAVRPRHCLEGWMALAAFGCAIAVTAVLLVPGWVWLPTAVQAMGVAAAAIGILWRGRDRGHSWWVMLAGALGWTIADAVLRLGSHQEGIETPWVSAALIVSYGSVATALALMTRRPGGQTETLIDGAVLGLAAVAVLWTCVIRPLTGASWPLPPSTMISLGHASAAAVLVFAVLRLTATDRTPTTVSTLLVVSALCLALADVTTAAPSAESDTVLFLGELAGQVWAVALGAAAIHRGPVSVQNVPSPPRPAVSGGRFVAFVALSLVAPMVPATLVLIAAADSPVSPADYLPGMIAAVAVCCLTVVRLGLVARVSDAQARDLRRSLRQRAALERELRHRATHDPLTGLANRAVLLDRIDRIISNEVSGTLIIIDLDGFKDVNDTLGHAAGDEVLLQVATRLSSVAAATDDLVVRLGGDEFALLCATGTDGGSKARAALDALRPGYAAGAGEVYLSGTAGLLDLAESGTSSAALRDADLALTAAKEMGKDQIVAFHHALRQERVRKGELASGLRKALVNGRLSVHYQPVVSLSDGKMAAVEALLRWTTEEGVNIPPLQFIPVAEETGLIVPVGRYVLRQACFDARSWHERYGIAVTVNVSGQQLREPEFVDDVLAALTETRLPPRALVLELTETTMITEIESTRALERLRELGVRVAIDDFGTGYSSLSYLVRLPVDILKIDREFTSPQGQPAPHHWAFVRAILDLARSLQLQTIAEGIETDQQAHTLRNLACPLAQGYLYSRPVPSAAVAELLSAWNARFDVAEDDAPDQADGTHDRRTELEAAVN